MSLPGRSTTCLTLTAVKAAAQRGVILMVSAMQSVSMPMARTLKTASFYNNILAPGQTRAVTVDGHMAKALAYTALAQGIRMPKDGPGPKGDRIGSVMSAMDGRV